MSFLSSFIEALIWSETNEHGDPLDEDYSPSDLSAEALAEITADCEAFEAAHWDMISEDTERAGHDFCLTRNGHGAGFWDGDWPEPEGTILTDAAHVYGTLGLYVGDDGKLYTLR